MIFIIIIIIFFNFSTKILYANRIAPDGTPRSAASHPGLLCLPMSHKRDARRKNYKMNVLGVVVMSSIWTGAVISSQPWDK